jgi:hypothetical protein
VGVSCKFVVVVVAAVLSADDIASPGPTNTHLLALRRRLHECTGEHGPEMLAIVPGGQSGAEQLAARLLATSKGDLHQLLVDYLDDYHCGPCCDLWLLGDCFERLESSGQQTTCLLFVTPRD